MNRTNRQHAQVFIVALAAALFVLTPAAPAQVGPAVPQGSGAQADAGSPRHTALAGTVLDRDLAARREVVEATPLGAPVGSEPALLDSDRPASSPAAGTARSVLALGAVITLILGLSWVFKRAARASGGIAGAMGAGGRAPAGIVEVLARYPVGSRQTLVVLRFDRRVLLCSMSSGSRSAAGGMTTLCELDNPEDVASVLVKTRDEAGDSIARSFERAMSEADLSVERAAGSSIRVRVPDRDADEAVVTRTGGLAPESDDQRGALARGLENLWRGGGR